MANNSTSLINNIKLVYRHYGTPIDLLKSGYFLLSVVLTAGCWRYTQDERWMDAVKTILPALVGFSIASFAIMFAILDERARSLLRAPSDKLGGKSPLLMLSSTIAHAGIIQITAIIFALVFGAKPFPSLGYDLVDGTVNGSAAAFGILLLNYAIVLVIASIVTVYRVIDIQSRLKEPSKPS